MIKCSMNKTNKSKLLEIIEFAKFYRHKYKSTKIFKDVEKYIVEVLFETEFTGWGPDGGIDGYTKHLNIPLQIKVWNRPVTEREIIIFIGDIKRYKHCIFVSTGGFSVSAKSYRKKAKKHGINLVFIDLKTLINIEKANKFN